MGAAAAAPHAVDLFGARELREDVLAVDDVSGAKTGLRHRAAGLHVRWGKLDKGRWRQGKGAKEVEEGSAAVAEPSRPGEKEAAAVED